MTAYCTFLLLFLYTHLVYLSNLQHSASNNINMTATTLCSLPVHNLLQKQRVWQINRLQCFYKIIHMTVYLNHP